MSSIPPPPPLPPSRSSTQPSLSSRNAFTRFVTQPFTSRPQANRVEIGKVAFVFPQKLPGLSPLSSQTSSFKVGAAGGSEITSLDVNRDKTHVILAGRDTLQTVRVDGKSLEEGTNIITAIVDRDRQSAIRHRDTLDIRDVKWSHGQYSSCIATAASNANVVIYDLSRPGVELARLHQHSRQVHKVAFSPFQGYWLLSASQDGTVRIWDLRSATPEVSRFHSRGVYFGESDGVRDVKWSPMDAMEFAFCTDRGSVQVWDFRQFQAPKLKFANAHDRSAAAVDWHPDGRHLLSAGLDQTVKIWDVTGDRRQKPQWQLRTPYPVMNARWRVPVCMYDENGSGSWLCTQIATSYEKQYPVVHVWDFRRPHIPFREACNWKTAPTDMIWPSQRLLWSTHREGQFHQTDVRFAPKVIDRRPMQAMAISPTGEICVFAQKRPKKRLSDADLHSSSSIALESMSNESFGDQPELSTLSRSVADDSIDDVFLSSSYRSTGKLALLKPSKATNGMNNQQNSPPGVNLDLTLPQSLNTHVVYTPLKQTSYRGVLSGTLDTAVFSYLAQKYKSLLPNFDLMESGGKEIVLKVFDDNAKYAQRSSRHRDAQLWKTLAQLIELEYARRLSIAPELVEEPGSNGQIAAETILLAEDDDNLVESTVVLENSPAQKLSAKNLQIPGHSSPVAIQESSSSMATPLAKARDREPTSSPLPMDIPEHVDDTIALPPSVISSSQPEMYLSKSDIEARKAQMSNWRQQPKQPLEYHLPSSGEDGAQEDQRPVPERHNSNESFAMLSSSADSPHGSALATSFTNNRSHRPSMSSIPEFEDPFLNEPLSLSDRPMFSTSGPDRSSTFKSQLSWATSSSSADMALRDPDVPAIKSVKPIQNGHKNKVSGLDKIAVKTDLTSSQTTGHHDSISTTNGSIKRELTEVELLLQQLSPLIEKQFDYYTDQLASPQIAYHLAQSLKTIFGQTIMETDLNGTAFAAKALPGIAFLKEEAVLSTYHDLLEALQIYNPAIELAKSSYKQHIDLFEQTNCQAGLVCSSCKKPINNSENPLRCETCERKQGHGKGRQSPCPICWQKYPGLEMARPKLLKSKKQKQQAWEKNAFEESLALGPVQPLSAMAENNPDSVYASQDEPVSLTKQTMHPVLWQACFVCGHGAHASCLQSIQADGRLGGKCPTEGCLCDCVAGPYREMLDKQAAESRATLILAREATLASVRRDSQRVGESRAVRSVRGMLDNEQAQQGISGLTAGTPAVGVPNRRVRLVEPTRTGTVRRGGGDVSGSGGGSVGF